MTAIHPAASWQMQVIFDPDDDRNPYRRFVLQFADQLCQSDTCVFAGWDEGSEVACGVVGGVRIRTRWKAAAGRSARSTHSSRFTFLLTFAFPSPTIPPWRSHAGSAKCMTSSPASWRSMATLR